jgi:Cu/Ag efflux protein CusF
MTTKRLLGVLLVVVGATIAVARVRRPPDASSGTRTFDVIGVVTARPADGRVTVAHADIPGYMPAMTMPFAIGPDAPTLAPGDRVRFTLRVANDWSRAEDIVVTGRDEATADAGAFEEGRWAPGVFAHRAGRTGVHVGRRARADHGGHLHLHAVSGPRVLSADGEAISAGAA